VDRDREAAAMNLSLLVRLIRHDEVVDVPGSRGDLARTFGDLGFTTGAEVGVWKGEFSEVLLKSNPGLDLLLCVDPWSKQPGYLEDKNDDAVMERAFKEAQARLAPYLRSRAIRKPSIEAARQVEDASLDFVYIDGNHRYEAVMQDLEAWTPKVRAGGIVAGHDFFTKTKKHIDVERAVRDFTQRRLIRPVFVLRSKEDATPSWFWVQR
jgi:hypothetical protein